MSLPKIQVVLFVAGVLPRIALTVILVRRSLRRLWPWFFLYCCYSMLADLVVLLSAPILSDKTYFLVYFACQLIYVVLGLVAMNEAFQRSFSVYLLNRRWFRLLIPTLVLVVVALSAGKWLHNISSTDELLSAAFLTFQLGGEYSRAAVFGFFGVLFFVWQPPRNQYAFAIMKGFGFFTIVGMMANLLRSDFGTKTNLFFSYAPPVAYIVACLIWLGGFLPPEPEKPAPGPGSLVNVGELRELVERLTRAIR